MPFFDIDTNNIQLNIDTRKFNYNILLFNFGNGGANIILKNSLENANLIGNTFSLSKSWINYIISGELKNIEDIDKEIKFSMEYKDFNNKKYSQEFQLIVRVSKNFYMNYYLVGRIAYYYNNIYTPSPTEIMYSYCLNKRVNIPKEIK